MTDKRNEGWETQEWEKITGKKKRALEVVIKFLVLNGVEKALKGVFAEGDVLWLLYLPDPCSCCIEHRL